MKGKASLNWRRIILKGTSEGALIECRIKRFEKGTEWLLEQPHFFCYRRCRNRTKGGAKRELKLCLKKCIFIFLLIQIMDYHEFSSNYESSTNLYKEANLNRVGSKIKKLWLTTNQSLHQPSLPPSMLDNNLQVGLLFLFCLSNWLMLSYLIIKLNMSKVSACSFAVYFRTFDAFLFLPLFKPILHHLIM